MLLKVFDSFNYSINWIVSTVEFFFLWMFICTSYTSSCKESPFVRVVVIKYIKPRKLSLYTTKRWAVSIRWRIECESKYHIYSHIFNFQLADPSIYSQLEERRLEYNIVHTHCTHAIHDNNNINKAIAKSDFKKNIEI